MKTHHTQNQFCPVCEHFLDAISSPYSDDKPKEGDVTVCIYCASFLQIGEDGEYSLMTDNDVAELDDEARSQLLKIRYAIKRLKEEPEPPSMLS